MRLCEVAAALLVGTVPNASAAQAAGVLNLWSGFNQTGQVQPVSAPNGGGRVTLEGPFQARSAGNRSPHTVALYDNEDCDGEPVAVVGSHRRDNFQPFQVGSVSFS
ncbi:peptidase inhibitor family I36 protein [Streptosporangium algeriense]|uniref:Peptidase inhibitor family I36 protein n=1 Tax=Streptosporangium algeriense TaxID=1682748 RepID=A0ABW3DVQ6_9ACTN